MEFKVHDPLFKTDTLFVLGVDGETFRRRMQAHYKRDVGELEGCLGSMFTFTRPPWRAVWTAKAELPIILHEVFHLVTRVCHDRGIVIRAKDERGDHGDETAAYLFEFYARAVLKKVRR